MVNPKLKEWLKLAAVVQESIPDVPKINCPSCSSSKISFEYMDLVTDPRRQRRLLFRL